MDTSEQKHPMARIRLADWLASIREELDTAARQYRDKTYGVVASTIPVYPAFTLKELVLEAQVITEASSGGKLGIGVWVLSGELNDALKEQLTQKVTLRFDIGQPGRDDGTYVRTPEGKIVHAPDDVPVAGPQDVIVGDVMRGGGF